MAAYSLYDVLRTLVDRVGWPTEQEKALCRDSINEAESMGIFGNLATMMTCKHDEGTYIPRGAAMNKCRLCDKIV